MVGWNKCNNCDDAKDAIYFSTLPAVAVAIYISLAAPSESVPLDIGIIVEADAARFLVAKKGPDVRYSFVMREQARWGGDMNARAEKSFNSAELPGFFLWNFAITRSVLLPLLFHGIGIRRSNEFTEGIKDEADTQEA